MRRSGLPVGWSEGFSPRPLIAFGLALPTGAESVAEYLDVVLRTGPHSSDELAAGLIARSRHVEEALGARLSGLLPAGVDVRAVAALPEGPGSLQQEVSSCSWNLEVFGLSEGELGARVERLLAAPSVLIERERKGRSVRDDLRPSVLALAVRVAPERPGSAEDPDGSSIWLDAELGTRPRGVRPAELLGGLGPEVRLARACRMHQWIERDGARWEPLAVSGERTGAVRTHAEWRAS